MTKHTLLPIGLLGVSLGMEMGWGATLVAAQAEVRSSPLAQVTVTSPRVLSGNGVVINGQVIAIPWIQWQSAVGNHIGIRDQHLAQHIGVELLNTPVADVQPVQWFSDPRATPLLPKTQIYQNSRYLDILPIANQFRWQVSGDQSNLSITIPPSQVMAVRQGRRTIGERAVVDLSSPTSWQATQDGQMLLLRVNAQPTAALKSQLWRTPGNLVKAALQQRKSPKLTIDGNSTLLNVAIPDGMSPQLSMLPSPPRLIVDFRPDAMVERDIRWAPGLRWRQQYVVVGSGKFPVIWLEVDPRQPNLQLRPIWTTGSTLVGLDSVMTLAQRWQAIAAINAGFFSRNTYSPLGAIRRDGVWYSSPILQRGAIAWTNDGAVAMSRLSLSQTLTTSTGQVFPVLQMNSGYVQAGLTYYTSAWGATYTPLTDNEVVITVTNNQVTQQQAVATAGQASIPIPTMGYLLVARSYRTATTALPVGTIVQLAASTDPPEFQSYPHIIGAGPLLLKGGQVVLDAAKEKFSPAFISEAAVRSAIATLPNGNVAIVTVQNRVAGRGPTLAELTQIMQQLGAVDALNLDGGSSTALYLGGQLLNRHPRTAARVHNSLGIFLLP
jgi:hypothetical protein